MEAKQSLSVRRRSADRKREIRERVFLLIAALVVVAGVVVFVQSRTHEGPAPTPLPAAEKPSPQQPVVKPGGTMSAAQRLAAVAFIRSALGRENLAKSWQLATPALRNGVTKQQWLRGELPFPPFPVDKLETSGFRVVGTEPNEILLEVLLVPKAKSGYVPTRFEVTLSRSGPKRPWKVSYFLPYAPPGMYVEPQ